MEIWLLVVLAVILVGGVIFFVVAPRMADRYFNRVVSEPPYAVSEAAQQLHEEVFVADLHADMLLWRRDPLKWHDRGHVDLPRLLAGGVGLQVFSVVTKSPWGQNYERTDAGSDRITLLAVAQRWPVAAWTSLKARALYQARTLCRAADRSGGTLALVRTREDLDGLVARRGGEATGARPVAGLLALEGLHAMEGDLANLDVLYEAGYRMMAPVHLFDNALGGSAAGVEKGGLTDLGRRAIRRMEELGVVLDLAHASPRLLQDALDVATRPVVVSHTGVQGTCPSARNLTDDQVRAVAATGGAVGIGYWAGAVCETTAEAVARAVRHAADLVGTAHVALGSDFDGTVLTPFDASGVALITEALLAEGFSAEEVRQVVGANVLRVLRATLPTEEEAGRQ